MEFTLRVLIVHDEPLVRSLLAEFVKSPGYEINNQLTKDWNLVGGASNSFSAVLPMPRKLGLSLSRVVCSSFQIHLRELLRIQQANRPSYCFQICLLESFEANAGLSHV